MKNEEKELNKNAWSKYNNKQVKEVFEFCEGYKNFMSTCKTERECVKEAIKLAKVEGYKDIEEILRENKKLQPGDKVFANNKGKTIDLFIIGN